MLVRFNSRPSHIENVTGLVNKNRFMQIIHIWRLIYNVIFQHPVAPYTCTPEDGQLDRNMQWNNVQ
jgi:hypothetical protein